MKTLITLPAINTYGELYATDGDELCAFQSNQKPFGPCIKMEPITGPLFDITVVADKFLYLLYKCGFMVAFFVSGKFIIKLFLKGEGEGMRLPQNPNTNR